MTIGTLNVKPTGVIISNLDRTTTNEAVDGSIHGYYWGSHKQIAFDLQWLTAEERQKLEALRSDKIQLVMDTGEKYNVRIALGDFTEIWAQGEVAYNVNIIATEVVT